MKTIRTTLLIFALLGAIMPAMAQVNFTEETEFYYDKNVSDVSVVTQTYLGVTDANGITLSSSKNALKSTAYYNEDRTMLRWEDTSCEASNKSYNTNFFQIVSAYNAIKYIRLYVKNGENSNNKLVVVGWKGEVCESADYYKTVNFTNGSNTDWVDCSLSDWDDVKTIRIYSGFNSNADLIVNGKTVYVKCNSKFYIYGIQVGLSSNTTSIGIYGFAAFSSTSALDFTNVTDCNAYYADSYANGTLHLTKVDGVVPANFGLLLCAPKDVTTPVCIPVATAKCTLTESDNAFVATSTGTYSPASTTDALVLGVKNGQAGFYYVGAGVTIPLNKMYLPAPKVAEAKSVVLDFGGIDPTGIVNVSDDTATPASSQRPATDILGRPCPNPAPGQIYIKDGKVRVK